MHVPPATLTTVTSNRYEAPLDAERMAQEQAAERARICHRLETMWQGLQADIEDQRDHSERGVDPRLQQLQLQVLKLEAQLWRMLTAPMPQPPEPPDPNQAEGLARIEAEQLLEEIAERLPPDGGR